MHINAYKEVHIIADETAHICISAYKQFQALITCIPLHICRIYTLNTCAYYWINNVYVWMYFIHNDVYA